LPPTIREKVFFGQISGKIQAFCSSSFIFKTCDMSKSIQIKAGTTRQETALTVALGIHINTSIKHYNSKAKHTVYEKHVHVS